MNINMDMDIKVKDYFSTTDLYEASFIYCMGPEFVGLNGNGETYSFIFSKKAFCQKLSAEYWSKKGSIAPKVYSEAIRTLKDIIFSKQR